jgi:hypothetical protein
LRRLAESDAELTRDEVVSAQDLAETMRRRRGAAGATRLSRRRNPTHYALRA